MSEESSKKRSFIRDHLLIVASVALPALIVLLFAAASGLPRLFTAAPAHDLVLVSRQPGTSPQLPVQLDVIVNDGQAFVLVRKRDEPVALNMPRVYLYTASTGSVREVSFDTPTDWDSLEDGTRLPIADLAGARLSTVAQAPDGYEYRGRRRRGNGLMFDLFGGGRYTGDVTIGKNGSITVISLPDHDQYWYGTPQFVGWVVEWQ